MITVLPLSPASRDDASWIIDRFYEADGVILATPAHYWNVSAQMKDFIERNYFHALKDKRSRAKIVGIIVVARVEGIEDTLYTLNKFVDWSFNVKKDKRFIVSGYAYKIGDAKNNLPFLPYGFTPSLYA